MAEDHSVHRGPPIAYIQISKSLGFAITVDDDHAKWLIDHDLERCECHAFVTCNYPVLSVICDA